ncbi:MAG: amidohydrolase family protein [Pseudomonadota bacterium]
MNSLATTVIEKAAWVVAWDAARKRHVYRRDIDVAFAGNAIVHVGPSFAGPSERVIDGRRLCVLPGLINIHCHPSSQPLYKGVREELGNPLLYMSALYDRTALFEPDEEGNRATCEYAISELLMSGVTTIAELSHPYPGWVDILAKIGIRAYVAPMFRSGRWQSESGHLVAYSWDEAQGRKRFAGALAVIDAARRHPCGRLSGMVVPAQVDTCSPELLRASIAAAAERGLPLQIHASQSVVEFHEMTRRHGKTPIQWLHEVGFLGPTTTIGHAIFLDHHSWLHWHSRDDLRLIAETRTSVAHCPTVFSRYGQTLEHLGKYLKAGVNVGIGTDTHPHNMLEEMRTAAILARVAAEDMGAVSTADIFHAATVGGARALGREDLGRLAPGMKADLVLVDAGHPAMRPLRDPLRSLIYTAAERAVRDVYVDGAKVVENGKVLTCDFAAGAERVEAAQRRAEDRVPEKDPKGLRGDQISPLALPVV